MFHADERESLRELLFPGSSEDEARLCEDYRIDAAEGGAQDEQRHYPRHHTQRPAGERLSKRN